MADRKRILVLTADAGFGHRSAANAVAAALEEVTGGQAEITIVNPLEDRRTPFFLRDSQADYDKIVRSLPELYRFGYDASDATLPAALMDTALIVLMYEVVRDLLRTAQPDAIISTYPLYSAPISAVFSITRRQVPYFVAITDLASIHRVWYNTSVDALMVPNQQVKFQALAFGFNPEQIYETGIPINPLISKLERSPAEVRAELGWDVDRLTILAVGSKRVANLVDSLRVVNHFGIPLQLAAVTGRDAELFAELSAVEWHIPVHLYEFSDNMPKLMQASDAIICKAGGLITTEALAAGLPMLFIDAIPGQETGNAAYVVDNGAGDLARTPLEVLEVLSHWTQSGGKLLAERSKNARSLGKPLAAYDIAKIVWNAAKTAPVAREPRSSSRFIELLQRAQVRWQVDDESTPPKRNDG